MKFEEAKEKYLQFLKITGYSPLTVKSAATMLKFIGRYLGKIGKLGSPVERLGAADLEGYAEYLASHRDLVTGRRFGARHIQKRLGDVRRFFRYLHQNDLIPRNPSEVIQVGARIETAPVGVMTREEVDRVISAPDVSSAEGLRDRAILELLYGCGLRAAELVALDVSDIDFEKGFVVVVHGKGAKNRVVPMADEVMDWLRRYLEGAHPYLYGSDGGARLHALFLTTKGERLSKAVLTSMIKRYKNEAGVTKPGSAHAFRHSIATHLLDSGMDIRHIQEFLGHSAIKSTEIYVAVSVAGLRKRLLAKHPRMRISPPEPCWSEAKVRK